MERRYGVRAISFNPNGDGVHPYTTSNGDVIPQPPVFYLDTGEYPPFIRAWYVWSFWEFQNMDRLRDDAACFNNPCEVGGYDGFGIAFSRNVVSVKSYEAQTWGQTDYYPPGLGPWDPICMYLFREYRRSSAQPLA